MRLRVITIAVVTGSVCFITGAMDRAEPLPRDLVKAAITRPWPGEGYPILPSLSTELRGLAANEIAGSGSIRKAYEKLDARRQNTEWFAGLKELEEGHAVWCVVSCLCHPSEDVQINALRALGRLGDKRVVPFLLIYADYTAVSEEGSENATIHGIIHKSIAECLTNLTGVKVKLEGQDPEGLKQGIRSWRKRLVEWEADQPV